MADLRVVYDGTISPNSVNLTNTFKGGRVAFITVSSLGIDQTLEIGISCIVRLPSLSGIVDKLWTELGTVYSDTAIVLPSEIADLDYDFYFALGSGDTVEGVRVYVTTDPLSLSIINAKLDEVLDTLATNSETANLLLSNELLQNTALSIFGTGLIPITADVTATIPPLLSSSLIPLLTG